MEVVRLAHGGAPVPYAARVVDAGAGSMSIEYSAAPSEAPTIHLLAAFVGEVRTDLSMTCHVNGEPLEPVLRAVIAANRWELEHTWGRHERGGSQQ